MENVEPPEIAAEEEELLKTRVGGPAHPLSADRQAADRGRAGLDKRVTVATTNCPTRNWSESPSAN